MQVKTEETARGNAAGPQPVPISETIVGCALALLGGLMVVRAHALPVVAHIEFGPGLFPTIVGGLMFLLGMALALRSRLALDAVGAGPAEALLRPPRPLLFIAYLGAPVLYILFSQVLGFLLISSLLFAGLAWLTAGRPIRALAVGIAMALLIHVIFVGLMRVTLPYGIIERLIGGLSWP